MELDWAGLAQETVETLREYLRIDTTNPPGNERAGARFREIVLAREGVPSRILRIGTGARQPRGAPAA